MVNGDEIRLSADGLVPPENPLTSPDWNSGEVDEGEVETPAQDDTAQSPAGSSGREVKAAGSGENVEEDDSEAVDETTAEGEEPAEEKKNIAGVITKERGEETETGTEQPWQIFGFEIDTGNGWLLAGLALVLVLLACLVADAIRRKLKRKRRKHASASAVYAGDGTVAAAVHQDIGAREDQQDSYGVSRTEMYAQQGLMAVVADGMGGLANGKAVSSTLVRTFLDGFPQVSGYYNQTADVLLDLSIRANAQINQMLRGADRSGSTLVAALVRDGYLHFLTVGDSRIYLYRGGALLQLNREHIYQEELAVKAVNQAVSMGQVRSDRQAHALTSYFGIGRIPSIDRNDEGIRLVPGDRILLASDGVFGTLSREQMEQALMSDIHDAAKQMGDMIRTEDKPYQDNNTLVLLEYKG